MVKYILSFYYLSNQMPRFEKIDSLFSYESGNSNVFPNSCSTSLYSRSFLPQEKSDIIIKNTQNLMLL